MDFRNEELLKRIYRYLLIHASNNPLLGLMNGKMGICIFFYHYARYTGNKHHYDYAGHFLDEIFGEIHESYPKSFYDGLAGIAWGISYLIGKGFVEGNPDEILESVDVSIMEKDIRRTTDISWKTGLVGYAYYVVGRFTKSKLPCKNISMGYIHELTNSLKQNNDGRDGVDAIIDGLLSILDGETPVCEDAGLLHKIAGSSKKSKSLFTASHPLGIDKHGYAGLGLKLLFENEAKENLHIHQRQPCG